LGYGISDKAVPGAKKHAEVNRIILRILISRKVGSKTM